MPKLVRNVAGALLCATLIVAALAGCSSEDKPTGPPPIYTSIVIAGPDTLLIGQTGTFVATVIDTGGNAVASPTLSWETSATGVADINGAGVASGVSEGDVLVRASGGGVVSNSVPLSVLQGYGWVDQSSAAPTVQNLRGVWFVTNREGWIVGDLGAILHTADSGKHWAAQTSNSTAYTLNAVSFISPSTGVVVGSAGRILRTTNGGTTWTSITADTDNLKSLNHVFFQDATRGWIVGNNGLILRSNNGGASWTRVLPVPATANLQRVAFPRNHTGSNPPTNPYGWGWAVGDGGTIVGSRDFGQTWRLQLPFATTDPLLGVARRDITNAIAVGTNNATLNTFASADSADWQLTPPTVPFANFTAVAWSDSSLVPGSAWAVGKRPDTAIPVALYSSDGGNTWTDQSLPGTAPLNGNGLEDVFFLDDLHGWAVGSQGLILHTATGGR
jgi:photosystem II stability/assembly factor-like uncharacterized protein